MNIIKKLFSKLKKVEDNERNHVIQHMSENGYIEYYGGSFIKVEWINDGKPYDRMAIPYWWALKSYQNRDDEAEWQEAAQRHKDNVRRRKTS